MIESTGFRYEGQHSLPSLLQSNLVALEMFRHIFKFQLYCINSNMPLRRDPLYESPHPDDNVTNLYNPMQLS